MREIVDFFKEAGKFFLATNEDGQPRVRPFGELLLYKENIYFNTNCKKKVYKQLKDNPKVELCSFSKGKWMRVQAVVVEDKDIKVKQLMLESQPAVKKMYEGKEEILVVFKLKQVQAYLYQFGKEEEKIV